MKKNPPCPCGQPATLDACCGLYHAGAPAPTPEALMRSRYTAYALGRVEYLLATWHSTTRPAGLDLTTPPQPRWIGLKIVAAATPAPHRGTVEFIARYRLAGRAHLMHEISRFVLEDGRWYYLDGEAIT